MIKDDNSDKEKCLLRIQIPLNRINPLFADEKKEKTNKMIVSQPFRSRHLPGSPYLINKKTFDKQELFLWANPLYYNKTIQKGSASTCWYNTLNYIKERGHYNESEDLSHIEKRRIEKLYSDYRFQFSIIAYAYQTVGMALDRLRHYYDDNEEVDLDFFDKLPIIIDLPTLINFVSQTKVYIEDLALFLKGSSLSKTQKHLLELSKEHFLLQTFHLKNRLFKQLNLHCPDLVLQFFKEQGYGKTYLVVNSNGEDRMDYLNANADYVLMKQYYKAFDLEFSNWTPKNSLPALLEELEHKGPHVFGISGSIKTKSPRKLLKTCSGFHLYQLETFSKRNQYGLGHSVVVVGGVISDSCEQVVYLIDPNDEYAYNKKPPVYAVNFDEFKHLIMPYEPNIQIPPNPLNGDKPNAEIKKHYAIYGRRGLELTRDPLLKKNYNLLIMLERLMWLKNIKIINQYVGQECLFLMKELKELK